MASAAANVRRRLSFRERQEWTELPGRIEALEHELHEVEQRMSDPAFFQGDAEAIRVTTQRAREIPDEIERAMVVGAGHRLDSAVAVAERLLET